VFTFILLPILTKEAFSDSFLLGLSFVWSAFLALSFAYVLKYPQVMILVYVGVILTREVTNNIFNAAREEVTRGNIIGAIIVFALGIYLVYWANHIKRGDV
jgi:hypothetical protein